MELVIDKALEIDVNIKIQDGGNVILDDDVDEAQNVDINELSDKVSAMTRSPRRLLATPYEPHHCFSQFFRGTCVSWIVC